MTVRFYFDHDSGDRPVVNALREPQIDLVTSLEAGNQRLTDEQQLEFAARHQRVIYSANVRDFARLHQSWANQPRPHAGIILRVFQQMPIGEQIRYLLVVATVPGGTANELLYLGPWLERS